MGKRFWSTANICTNTNGELRLDNKEFQGLISRAENSRSAAFIVYELDKYTIDTYIDDTHHEQIVISSGVGDQICKEEWRGDIVANLFYPKDGASHKAIVHLNGGVTLLQDGRAIMLAHEGYTVLEVGYNLPQYGQMRLFDRHPQGVYSLL